ncbi:MAG: nucleoside-diphosphate sugar epimerase/dehydratase [Dysosmobacter welbionis]
MGFGNADDAICLSSLSEPSALYKGRHQIPVAIVGAGAAGVQLLEELQSNPDSRYNVQCFFDDDPEKLRKRIHGVEVKGRIDQVQDSSTIDIREIIVAIPSADEDRRHEIFQRCLAWGIKVSVLPSTLDMIHRKPIHTQLQRSGLRIFLAGNRSI